MSEYVNGIEQAKQLVSELLDDIETIKARAKVMYGDLDSIEDAKSANAFIESHKDLDKELKHIRLV